MSGQEPWTYTSLTEALHHRTIILRVHTHPFSPLDIGFTARNPAFKGLSIDQYHFATACLKGEKWAEGLYMRDVIIDHINQLVRQPQPQKYGYMGKGWFRLPESSSRFRQTIPLMKAETDEMTPWISTTASLDWAIWYIAKLLSQPGNGPRHDPGMKHHSAKLTVISISTDRKRNTELYVAPFLQRPAMESRCLSPFDRQRYNRASKAAVMAKEVLFYGRIFKESVKADMTFTREKLPFSLPSVYYNPPEMHNPTFASSWMGRLRWDPRLLNYEMAQYNRMKMMGPRCMWGNQPVDLRLQEFKRGQSHYPDQGGHARRIELVIRPPGKGREAAVTVAEEKVRPVEVLVGELVDLSS